MANDATRPDEDATLPQGDLGLLDSDVARRLLASALRARIAFVAKDGTPRVVPSWFHWTGDELVMPTFVRAPHVRAPARRIAALRANPAVAVTIDTDAEPPEVLLLRGRVSITEVDGIVPEYALEARRYLDEQEATALLAQIDRPGTRMARIALRPSWVGLLDFHSRLPSVMSD
jgi:Pyridoxamine 5'-phosphate oxidase